MPPASHRLLASDALSRALGRQSLPPRGPRESHLGICRRPAPCADLNPRQSPIAPCADLNPRHSPIAPHSSPRAEAPRPGLPPSSFRALQEPPSRPRIAGARGRAAAVRASALPPPSGNGLAQLNGFPGLPGLPPLPGNGAWYPGQAAGEESLRDGGRDGHRGSKLRLFSGSANGQLAREVAAGMGLELGRVLVKRFADGEIYVQLQESVRGCDVFLIQPTCPPANENLMELLIMIDACRRASAKTITAVVPYFGYARADRKTQGRESIAAKLVANMITSAGADRVLACDLHSGQSVGYFDIPVDQVYGQPVILEYLASKMMTRFQDLVVVSPDVGGVARARAFAKKLSDAPLAIVDKRRQGHNVAEVMNLIGDVRGKVAIMVDDMIDTAGTIYKGAQLLREAGAAQVYACCTHPVFSPPAIERLSSGLFEEVITTNTIPLASDKTFPQLTILSMANLLGEAIWQIHDESCSSNHSAAALDMD